VLHDSECFSYVQQKLWKSTQSCEHHAKKICGKPPDKKVRNALGTTEIPNILKCKGGIHQLKAKLIR